MNMDYLPIGSVVLLKGGEDRLMVIGRIVAPSTDNKIYDYAACPFPGGLGGIDQLYCFNNDQIERVYFIGFQDPEELELQEYLSGLGELYITEDGQIAERGKEETAPEAEPAPESDEVEAAVFADVD